MECLQTKRLILRPFLLEDAEDTFAYCRDPQVGLAAGWQPHRTIQETQEIIETVFAQPHVFAVVEKVTGQVIGSAGYVGKHREDFPGFNDELGYALSPAFWGQGLMPEAVAELLRYGFVDRGLDVIWCNYYDGNDRSRRVIEKCGFRVRATETEWVEAMGETRTVILCAMTREEWAS